MKQIIVISGKGGTGKTIITASLAVLAKNKVMADCDVDAADLHLLLHPRIKEKHEFRSGQTAILDKDKCIICKKCIEPCRFGAISKIDDEMVIDPISCEGCKVCSFICPTGAIWMEENVSGQWFVSDTKYGPMVHAKLGIAEENSGKLVTTVKKHAKQIAEEKNLDLVIADGPPGIGCAVIASMAGTDMALLITEPTLSGIHDLERVNQVARHFGIKTAVCINKYDINIDITKNIRDYCLKQNMEVLEEVPFDKTVVESLVRTVPIVEHKDFPASKKKGY